MSLYKVPNISKKTKLKLQIKTLIVFVLALVIVLIVYFYKHHAIYKSIVKSKPPVMIVNFTKVKLIPWAPIINSIGTVHSDIGVALTAQVAGNLYRSEVKNGAIVKKGDLLYVIFPKVAEATLDKAKASLFSTKSDYERKKKIFDQLGESGLSKQDLDESLSKYMASVADVKNSESKITFYEIRSPIDGKVGINQVRFGDYIPIGHVINNVIPSDSSAYAVYFKMPATEGEKVGVGDIVNYTYLSANNKIIKSSGKIMSADTVANEQTRMQLFHASFADKNIIPGRYIEVAVEAGKKIPVMTLPEM